MKKAYHFTKATYRKRYLLLIIITTLFNLFPYLSQAQKRSARFEAEFQKVFQIVNSDHFIIKFFMATPSGQTFVATPLEGPNIAINPEECLIEIQDSLIRGKLPYYGNGSYWMPKPGQDTIRFNNIIFSRTVKVYPLGNKKGIAYRITILTKNNVMSLNMDIRYDGTCYLYFNDEKRYPISYMGNVYPLKIKDKTPQKQ